MDKKNQNKQMAFWRYDVYPGFLCGTVTKTIPDGYSKGYVETKEFGAGTTFKPHFILPYDKGLELKEKLEELKIGRAVEIQNVNINWQNKLNDLKKSFGLAE